MLLGLLVLLRLIQTGGQLADLDPVEEGWLAIVPALGIAAAFGRPELAAGQDQPAMPGQLRVDALPDDLARVGIPVGVAMVCVLLPVLAFLFGYQILFGLNREAALAIGFDPSPVVDRITDVVRTLLGLILIGIGAVLARRQRLGHGRGPGQRRGDAAGAGHAAADGIPLGAVDRSRLAQPGGHRGRADRRRRGIWCGGA